MAKRKPSLSVEYRGFLSAIVALWRINRYCKSAGCDLRSRLIVTLPLDWWK